MVRHRATHLCLSCWGLVDTTCFIERPPNLIERYGAAVHGTFCAVCESEHVVDLGVSLTAAEARQALPLILTAIEEMGLDIFVEVLEADGLDEATTLIDDDEDERDTIPCGPPLALTASRPRELEGVA